MIYKNNDNQSLYQICETVQQKQAEVKQMETERIQLFKLQQRQMEWIAAQKEYNNIKQINIRLQKKVESLQLSFASYKQKLKKQNEKKYQLLIKFAEKAFILEGQRTQHKFKKQNQIDQKVDQKLDAEQFKQQIKQQNKILNPSNVIQTKFNQPNKQKEAKQQEKHLNSQIMQSQRLDSSMSILTSQKIENSVVVSEIQEITAQKKIDDTVCKGNQKERKDVKEQISLLDQVNKREVVDLKSIKNQNNKQQQKRVQSNAKTNQRKNSKVIVLEKPSKSINNVNITKKELPQTFKKEILPQKNNFRFSENEGENWQQQYDYNDYSQQAQYYNNYANYQYNQSYGPPYLRQNFNYNSQQNYPQMNHQIKRKAEKGPHTYDSNQLLLSMDQSAKQYFNNEKLRAEVQSDPVVNTLKTIDHGHYLKPVQYFWITNIEKKKTCAQEKLNLIIKIRKLTFPKYKNLELQIFRYTLQTIHAVNLSNLGLQSIISLKEIVNLRTLDLSSNNLKSIKPIESSTNLQRLYLSNNFLTNLDGLCYFKSLKQLTLHENKLTKEAYVYLMKCPIFGLKTLSIGTSLYSKTENDVSLGTILQEDKWKGLENLHLKVNFFNDFQGTVNIFNYNFRRIKQNFLKLYKID